MHELHKVKNRSCELQNSLSLAAEELHLEFHDGSSNGLTQVTRHSNKSLILKFYFQVVDPNIAIISNYRIIAQA